MTFKFDHAAITVPYKGRGTAPTPIASGNNGFRFAIVGDYPSPMAIEVDMPHASYADVQDDFGQLGTVGGFQFTYSVSNILQLLPDNATLGIFSGVIDASQIASFSAGSLEYISPGGIGTSNLSTQVVNGVSYAVVTAYLYDPTNGVQVAVTGYYNYGAPPVTTSPIGNSPVRPSPPSDTNFVTDLGKAGPLTCTPRSKGPITFDVDLTRYLATTNGAGMLSNLDLLISNAVVSDTATLLFAVYNTKLANATGTQPERDAVSVNGHAAGAIDFTNNGWGQFKVDVPISQILFPDQMGDGTQTPATPPLPAHNHFSIDIDVANSSDTFCVAVDWAQISFGAQAPLMLIHGTNADHTTWEFHIPLYTSPVQYLQQSIGVDFEWKIDLEPNGSFAHNANQLAFALARETTRRGVHNIHLVTHSKGASDSRYYLAKFYQPSVFKVLSLYALGTPSQGTILSDLAVEAEKVVLTNIYADPNYSTDPIVTGLFSEFVDTSATNFLGNMAGLAPVDPARALQRVNMHDFNEENSAQPGIPYYSLAGNADANGDGMLSYPEAQGMFPSFVAPSLVALLANRAYQALGRVRSVSVQTSPGLRWWNRKYTLVQAEVSPTPEPNDMVSVVSSVHCTLLCNFKMLGNTAHPDAVYPYNHTNLKSDEIMQTIWDNITSRFPVKPY